MFKTLFGALLFVLVVLSGFIGSSRILKVTCKSVAIRFLPEELKGLRILHITDLHANNHKKMNLDIWKTIRKQEFDIVCITGDIIDRNAYQIEPHLDGIMELCGIRPVFFAEGNHDHRSIKRLRPYLEDAGVKVLIDESADYEFNGKLMRIIGLDDFYMADLDVSRKLVNQTGIFKIVLMHQPQHIDYVDIKPGALVLSGHTHAGQIRFPFLRTLYGPGQGVFPYYGRGIYDINGDKSVMMYISNGIGATGKAPVRFWNRPEISIITLKGI